MSGADWKAPEGHTTSLDPAIAELGDAMVVDESLPADGIVESPRPDLDGVMTAHTVYAEFAKPETSKSDAAASKSDASKKAPAKKAPAKAAGAKTSR